jgi:hypothetical protein
MGRVSHRVGGHRDVVAGVHRTPGSRPRAPARRRSSRQLIASLASHDLATALQQSIRRWGQTMAALYNAGHAWPHPVERRTVPQHLINHLDFDPEP